MTKKRDRDSNGIANPLRDRVQAVEQALVANESMPTILQRFAKQWKVGYRQVRRYVKVVRDTWAREAREEDDNARLARREFNRATMQDLLQLARSTGELDLAFRIADRLCQFDGLYPVPKAAGDITAGAPLAAMTDEQKWARIDELLAQAKRDKGTA